MRSRKGFSLVELMIVVLILGALAAIAIPRIIGGSTTAKVNACKVNVNLINAQMELYKANNVDYTDLVTLFADANYFPDGTPECPYETAYALGSNNRVDKHSHP